MLQDLAVGPLHFSGRARMCHRRMRMYLAHRTRTPCRVASRISRACTARSSPRDSQRSVAPSSRVRIGRGRLCSVGRGNSEHPPEDFCSIRGVLPPESFFSRRGVSLRDGSLQRLCRGTASVPIGRIPQSSFNQPKKEITQ